MPHLSTYIGLADHSEKTLAESFRAVADGHAAAVDVFHMGHTLAAWSDTHRDQLVPIITRYSEQQSPQVREPERLHADGLVGVRDGQIGLLRDLQDLHVLASLVQTTWTVLGPRRPRPTRPGAAVSGHHRQHRYLTTTHLAQHPHESRRTPSPDRRPVSG